MSSNQNFWVSSYLSVVEAVLDIFGMMMVETVTVPM